jgi:hypothetical protein
MELDLNRLPDDAVHVGLSQFGGDDTGVLELDAMPGLSVNFYQNTKCHPREDRNLHTEILKVIITMKIFWFVIPRKLIEKHELLRGNCCFHAYSSILKMKAAGSSETMVLN